MKVVDSCVWMDWVTNGPSANAYEELFSDLSTLTVPTIVIVRSPPPSPRGCDSRIEHRKRTHLGFGAHPGARRAGPAPQSTEERQHLAAICTVVTPLQAAFDAETLPTSRHNNRFLN